MREMLQHRGRVGVPVLIDNKQSRAVQIDADDAIGMRRPPGPDLRPQCGCFVAPPDNGFFLERAILQLTDGDRKHGDATGSELERGDEIVAHHTPPRITMGDEGQPNFSEMAVRKLASRCPSHWRKTWHASHVIRCACGPADEPMTPR